MDAQLKAALIQQAQGFLEKLNAADPQPAVLSEARLARMENMLEDLHANVCGPQHDAPAPPQAAPIPAPPSSPSELSIISPAGQQTPKKSRWKKLGSLLKTAIVGVSSAAAVGGVVAGEKLADGGLVNLAANPWGAVGGAALAGVLAAAGYKRPSPDTHNEVK